jgi:hypothetical protein
VIDGQLSPSEGGVEIALLGVGHLVRVDRGRFVEAGMVGMQLDVVRRVLVLHADQPLGLRRRLRAGGDHGGDQLPAVGDPVGLEQRELAVVDLAQARRVAVPEHSQHARHGQRIRGVHRADGAFAMVACTATA